MDLVRKALDVFLHLDRHLNTRAGDLGGWLYGLLFLIVFCETGLVVTPVLLCVAAVLGLAVNYGAG
jgi:membrane-associated protein